MKSKRSKNNKKSLFLYSQVFQFRFPFQILVDGNFIHQSLKIKSNLESSLCRIFKQVKLFTTPCVTAELLKLGLKEAAELSKTFIKQRCPHTPCIPASDCLLSLDLSKTRFAIATQQKSLRHSFALTPGIPLVYISNGVYLLEPPSKATLDYVHSTEISKNHKLNASEVKLLKTVVPPKKEKKLKFQKKSKRKEPNPLSCKKKKVVVPTSTQAPLSKAAE